MLLRPRLRLQGSIQRDVIPHVTGPLTLPIPMSVPLLGRSWANTAKPPLSTHVRLVLYLGVQCEKNTLGTGPPAA